MTLGKVLVYRTYPCLGDKFQSYSLLWASCASDTPTLACHVLPCLSVKAGCGVCLLVKASFRVDGISAPIEEHGATGFSRHGAC